MDNEKPSHFFKYRSLEGHAKERARRTIVNSTIWFAKPEDFNDLFDCSPDFTMAAPAQVFKQYMKGLPHGQGPAMNRQALRTKFAEVQQNSPVFLAVMRERTWRSVNEAGILSLSTRPDQILMWSHYAASHTGICLRFGSAPEDFPFRAAQRVIYCADRPVLNPILDDAEAIVSKTILSKADVWAYEDEWRVLSHPGSPVRPGGGHGLITYAPSALNGIILGARISKADAADVASWVQGRKYPVALFRAVADPHRFHLDIVPIQSGL